MTRYKNLILVIIAVIFVTWSAVFIYRVSFTAIDGQLYTNLFDDAMISMRYAWNFSHGQGLVWNEGEYVEGYTNLLMTLFMALVMFVVDDKRLSVLIIHISGIIFMLGIGYVSVGIARLISSNESEQHRSWLEILTLACVLFYYPLAYWSLMGMETGLVTLLVLSAVLGALQYAHNQQPKDLFLPAVFLGLGYLTRPDALIAAVLIFLFLFYEAYQFNTLKAHLKYLLTTGGVCALFVVGQQIFRLNYYGEMLPNTYTLKAVGMPLLTRLRNGLGYILPFLRTTLIALFLMAVGLLFSRKNPKPILRQKLLLVFIIIAYIYYQIWIGGDAFPPYWRMVAPAIPLLLVLCIQSIIYLADFIFQSAAVNRRFPKLVASPVAARVLIIGSTFLVVTLMNYHFWPELTLSIRPYEAKSNEYHVNTAIALNTLTTPAATIGVTSAGTVPYFSDRVAIDFLGKSDRHIANLPPDLSGATNYHGMLSLPGHNKYDLNYSIKGLQPTYVQTHTWGQHILKEWVEEHYTTVMYKGVQLYLLRDDDTVRWDQIEALN